MNSAFAALYASEGRPPIQPEQLLSALLLQVFYGIRPERQLMEQLNYNLLFRWFAGLAPDAPVRAAGHGANLRALGVTPHVARNNGPAKTGKRRTAIIDDAVKQALGIIV